MSDYGHDEAMRDINAIAYDDGCLLDRISNYIEALVQENKTWQQEYALLRRERDEWEAVARYIVEVLACDHDNCYIDASEDDCERCVSEGSEKWIAFAREQVSRG